MRNQTWLLDALVHDGLDKRWTLPFSLLCLFGCVFCRLSAKGRGSAVVNDKLSVWCKCLGRFAVDRGFRWPCLGAFVSFCMPVDFYALINFQSSFFFLLSFSCILLCFKFYVECCLQSPAVLCLICILDHVVECSLTLSLFCVLV